jgi:leader peptidase (prepilin peptidase) / N-methyltransferase
MFVELLQLGIATGTLLVFVYIAWVDLRTMEIPDRCHLILLGFACLQIFWGSALSLETRELGLVAMSLPMIFVNLAREGSFGGGDIKMCGATGFLLGAPQMLLGAVLALMLAGVYGGIALLLKIKKPKDSFALGPFLSVGFIASMLSAFLG